MEGSGSKGVRFGRCRPEGAPESPWPHVCSRTDPLKLLAAVTIAIVVLGFVYGHEQL